MKLVTYTRTHTASTLVANINTGLLEPGQPIFFDESPPPSKIHLKNFINSDRLTLKCHSRGKIILKHIQDFSNSNLHFVYVNRQDRFQILNSFKNLTVLDYNKLLYRSESLPDAKYSLDEVLNYVIDQYKSKINNINKYLLNFDSCKSRILKMDETYHKIKNLPFTYYDPFFHIHGSHKNQAYKK